MRASRVLPLAAALTANVVGSAVLQLARRAPRGIIGTTATVVAGGRYTQPVNEAVLLDLLATDGKHFRLLTDVSAWFGSHAWTLRRGFRWNGADIPWWLAWLFSLLGVSKYDPRLALASGFHDDVCNEANEGRALRVIGDAIFISLLMPVTFNGVELPGIGMFRASLLYAGVRLYSLWRFLRTAHWGQLG